MQLSVLEAKRSRSVASPVQLLVTAFWPHHRMVEGIMVEVHAGGENSQAHSETESRGSQVPGLLFYHNLLSQELTSVSQELH